MNTLHQGIIGLADFIFKLIISMFLLRIAAIKLHNTPQGQGIAALVF